MSAKAMSRWPAEQVDGRASGGSPPWLVVASADDSQVSNELKNGAPYTSAAEGQRLMLGGNDDCTESFQRIDGSTRGNAEVFTV